MADTEQTLSQLLDTIFADGQSDGAITPQDMRDLIVSLANPRGGMYVADGDSAQTTISAANTYTRVAGTTTASPNARDFSMVGNNQLQYDGTVDRPVFVTATASVVVASNNTEMEFALGINGTPVLGRTEQKLLFQNSNEDKLVAINGIIQLSEGDEIGLFVQNVTDATNMTASKLVVDAIGFLE